jgi:polyphosphate kinase
MRRRFQEMLDVEMANALEGRKAHLIAKMNGLDDKALVEHMYRASQAGVKIDLLVRGNCRIRPGLPGISENIRVFSIIGRFLEHHRIFRFENNGDPRFFFGSADWMFRNLSHRVEAIVPIESSTLKDQLQQMLDIFLTDRRTTWEMLPDGRYRLLRTDDPTLEDQRSTDSTRIGTHEALMNLTLKSMF